MGYTTYYKFTFSPSQKENVIREWMRTNLFRGGDLPDEDEYRWDDWEADMHRVSMQFPSTLIVLEGQGEDHDDIWKAYFKNGKSVVKQAMIVHPALTDSEIQRLQL